MIASKIAANYARSGLALVPVRPRAKQPYNPSHPEGENWEQCPITTPEQAEAHWDEHPDDNISWLMGKRFVTMDFDLSGGKQGRATLAWFARYYPAICTTLTQRTQSGGWHKIFELKPEQRGRLSKHTNAKLGPYADNSGVSVITGNAAILVAPSKTQIGAYKWKDVTVEIAEMPDGLFELLLMIEQPSEAQDIIRCPTSAKLDSAITALLRWGWFERCGYASPAEARAAVYQAMNTAGCAVAEIAATMEKSLLFQRSDAKRLDLTGEELVEDIERVLALPHTLAPSTSREGQGAALCTLERGADRRILSNEANLARVLSQPEMCGMSFAYDTFQQRILVTERGCQTCRPLEESDYAEVRVRLSSAGFQRIAKDLIRDLIHREAMLNKYDSAQDWLSALEWDGVARVDEFLSRYLGTDDTAYHRGISRYWWTAMAGRVMRPGVKADMAPILVGKQGVKKSTALRSLVPDEMHFTEISLSTKDEELARLVQGRIVCEMAELSGLHGRDRDATKAYLTKQHDRVRPLYESLVVSHPRRFVICGTTNEDDFLSDPTGERRWLPFAVGKVDVDAIVRDRDQLWAEAREIFEREGIAHAVPDQIEGQREFRRVSVLVENIEEWLDSSARDPRGGYRPFTLSEVITGVTGDIAVNTKKHEKAYTDALKELGFGSKQSRLNGEKKRYWARVEPHDAV